MLPLSLDHEKIEYVLLYIFGPRRDVSQHGVIIADSA